jgi:hypothetical protein
MPNVAYPMAKIYARTSKLARYYWREISQETIAKFAEWAETQGFSDWTAALGLHQEMYKSIEKQIKEKINILHEHSPKYIYHEESQSAIIQKHNVEIVNINATYVKNGSKGVQITENNIVLSAEEFAIKYFERLGFQAIVTESIPFHVIFGVFTYLLIQDFDDNKLQLIGFRDRFAFENGVKGNIVETFLPSDFGTPSYSQRRKSAIVDHFKLLPDNEEDKNELFWLFDYWLEPSAEFRQYLWAHRLEDVVKARQILSILPVSKMKKILLYLVENYWKRYLGWSDLLVYNDSEYFFAEVKSSKDQISEDQKVWIAGNTSELHLPFKLVKIHRKSVNIHH